MTEVGIDSDIRENTLYSYHLCIRFYGDEIKLRKLAAAARKAFSQTDDVRLKMNLCALLGNIHHLLGDYGTAAGYFIETLSYTKEDVTAWIELLFCLRDMGHFKTFQAAVFNLEKLYEQWQKDPEVKMTQGLFMEMISQLES
jgi:hypothetical protein